METEIDKFPVVVVCSGKAVVKRNCYFVAVMVEDLSILNRKEVREAYSKALVDALFTAAKTPAKN